jgi:DNA topoisomerase II
VWTRNYKNFLEELAQKDVISDIKEFHKDNNVHFVLTIPDLKKYSNEQIEKDFRLVANMSCSNFVLFDKDYKIKRYNSEVDIMEEFFTFRFDMYAKRKA